MRPFFSHWPEIARRLQRAPQLFIGLDYDGVLSPIARQPRHANLSPRTRRLLRRLADDRRFRVAIISGRALADVQKKVGLKKILYAGNHGLEIQWRGRTERHGVSPHFHRDIQRAKESLIRWARRFPKASVEDKGISLSVHYRAVPRDRLDCLRREFQAWRRGLPSTLRVSSEKMGFDIHPRVPWNKGRAVLKIWREIAPRALPLYLGDDVTDEDAFRALKGKGITLCVAPHRLSAAQYSLRSPADVFRFLQKIERIT